MAGSSGALSTLMNIGASFGMAALQDKYNRRMYEQQYQDSIDFYNMQLADQERLTQEERDYNSPAAQAARMREAGLNPQLQGNINGAPTSAATAPSPNVPKQEGINFQSLIPDISVLGEQIISFMSAAEDLKSKRIANRSAEDAVIDSEIFNALSFDDIKQLTSIFEFGGAASTVSDDSGKLNRKMLIDAIMQGKGLEAVIDPEMTDKVGATIYKIDPVLSRLFNMFSGMSRRQRKKLFGRAVNRFGSLVTNMTASEYESRRRGAAYSGTETASKPGFSNDMESSEFLTDFFKGIMDAQRDLAKLDVKSGQQKFDIAEKQKSQAAIYERLFDIINRGMESGNFVEKAFAWAAALAMMSQIGISTGSVSARVPSLGN